MMNNGPRLACSLMILMSLVDLAPAQEPNHVVLITHRVTNVGKTEATSVTAHCILPTGNGYQELLGLKIHPKPELTQMDGEGQPVMACPLGPLAPGETRAVRALAWVRPKARNVALVPRKDRVEPLSDEVRETQLQDGPLLELDKVRPVAEKVIGTRKRDIDKARALYEHMAEHCQYGIDTRTDRPSGVLLEQKPGSCTELALAYIALCRSVGIPARVVSAYVNRDDREPSADWRTHRWAEFFAENIGWVPVDPTNRINIQSKNFFGQQLGRYLVVLDDGRGLPEGQDPGWYVLWATVEPRNTLLEAGRTAFWEVSHDRPTEEQFFQEAIERLHDTDAAKRCEAVHSWARDKKPLRAAMWLEALLDSAPEVRRAAASELGQSGYAHVLLAMMFVAEYEPDDQVRRDVLDAAKKILSTDDAEDRAEAVSVLSKSRTSDALYLLDGTWKDESREVRKALAHTFYKFGDEPKVHEAYGHLVNDADDYVATVSAIQWAKVGAHKALEALANRHLESEVRWDRQKAIEELKRRTGDDFGYDPESPPTSRRNREAIEKLRAWVKEHPEAK